MMKRNRTLIGCAIAMTVVSMVACSPNPQSPGVEYMPDMYRSPAIEAFQSYSTDSADLAVVKMRKPVKGTIPHTSQEKMVYNMPYPFPETEEGYLAAGVNFKSPLPTKKEYIEQGKEIFERMCIQCHGEAGAGDGSITQAAGGKYPVVPTYQSRAGLEEGKMFHTLTYGRNLMGSHAAQLSQEERWKVIQYVKVLMYEVEEIKYDKSGNVIGNPFAVTKAAETNETEG